MAVKASASITLTLVVEIEAYYRYYLLQSSTLTKPSKPTTNPPSGSWDDTEPTYTAGSTNSLYFVDLTVFSDGTWSYSEVSLSSSYEAAKEAYNKAANTESNLANNYYTKIDTDAQINVTKESITSTVSSTYATKSALNTTNSNVTAAQTAAATAQSTAATAQTTANAAQSTADNALPKSGGTMTGELKIGQDDGYGIQLGTNGRINGTTSDGNATATIVGLIGSNAILGHSAFNATLRGKNSKPTYNGSDLAMNSDVVTCRTLIDQTDENITALAERVGTNESNIASLEITADSIVSTVTAAQSAADAAQADIDNLEIGGRNLLPFGRIAYHSTTLIEGTSTEYLKLSSTGRYDGISIPYDLLELNTQYVLSYDLTLLSGNGTVGGHSGFAKSAELYVDGVYMGVYASAKSLAKDTKVHVTVFMVTSESVDENSTPNIYIQSQRGSTSPITMEYVVENLKLEKGNKATDWTPAPEDVDAAVTALETRMSTAETNIKQTSEQIDLMATKTEVTETLDGYYTIDEANAAIKLSADNITQSVSNTYQTIDAMSGYSTTEQMKSAISQSASEITSTVSSTYATKTQLAAKADDYSIGLYNGTGGNPKAVKFATVDYSTCNSENGVSAKISMVSGHGNGTSYAFLQDATIRVNYVGGVEVDNVKQYGAVTSTYDGAERQYGDIFWVIDTTNKIVDFYVLMGQYARVYQTPWKRLTSSSGGTVTQYTSCTVYSSGTKVWANNSDIALMSDVAELSTRITQTESDIELCATKTELNTVSDDLANNYYTRTETEGMIQVSATNITSTVSSVSVIANSALSAAGAAQENIDNLEIGGRNLWINTSAYRSDTPFETTSTSADNYISSFDGKCIYCPTPFKAGDVITVQGKSNLPWSSVHSSGSNGKAGFWLYLGTLAQVSSGAYISPIFLGGDNSNTEFVRTYTVPTVSGITDIYIGFRFNTYSASGASLTGQFWDVKMERGNKATDWTPAPEDVDANVAAVSEVVDSLIEDIEDITGEEGLIATLSTEINQTDEQWRLAVQKTEETIEKVDGKVDDVQSTINTYETWFTMDSDGFTIGKTEDGDELPLKVRLDNDSLDFLDNDTVVAYVSNEKLMINAAEVEGTLDVGGFRWTIRDNGNMGLMWIGG